MTPDQVRGGVRVLFAALSVVGAHHARAEETRSNPVLAKARSAYESADFRLTIKLAEQALRASSGDSGQQAEILLLLGQAQAADNRRAEAESTFDALFKIRPEAELDPDVSPKLFEPFQAAKKRLFAPNLVVLEPLEEKGDLIRAKLIDPWRRVTQLAGFGRAGEVSSWDPLTVDRRGSEVTVELARFPSQIVYWYVEAKGINGEVLARLGSADSPQSHTVAGRESPPATSPPAFVSVKQEVVPGLRRWAWAPLAGGLAAGGVGTACALLANSDYQQLNSPTPNFANVAAAQSARNNGEALQTTAVVLFGVGAAALGAAGWMYAFSPPGATAVQVSAMAAPSGGWVGIRGTIP
jgi:tetratricopeptide (TPR) repeat protein